MITKVDNRLAGWKAKCLSLAGRLTLIQATITAIPAYVMQSARLSWSLCDKLDRKVQRFLWGGSTMQRKPYLVAWKVVTKEKEEGGLGLRSIRQLNSAYLMKLRSRLQTEDTALWTRVLKEKYGRGRDLLNSKRKVPLCSNAWRGLQEMFPVTKQGMGLALGDGRQTQLWSIIFKKVFVSIRNRRGAGIGNSWRHSFLLSAPTDCFI